MRRKPTTIGLYSRSNILVNLTHRNGDREGLRVRWVLTHKDGDREGLRGS